MKLAIYCAGGLGKEVYDLVVRNCGDKYSEIFFVDDIRQEHVFYGIAVRKFEDIKNNEAIEFAIATGEPFVRQNLRGKINNAGFKLVRSIIDKTAIISPTAKISDGVMISANCFVSSDTIIGENSFLQPSCLVCHDSSIGKDCVVSSFCQISGNCKIGNTIYVGVGSCIREKIKIGSGSIIGMGSFVHKDIDESMIAFGNPARSVRANEAKRVFALK